MLNFDRPPVSDVDPIMSDDELKRREKEADELLKKGVITSEGKPYAAASGTIESPRGPEHPEKEAIVKDQWVKIIGEPDKVYYFLGEMEGRAMVMEKGEYEKSKLKKQGRTRYKYVNMDKVKGFAVGEENKGFARGVQEWFDKGEGFEFNQRVKIKGESESWYFGRTEERDGGVVAMVANQIDTPDTRGKRKRFKWVPIEDLESAEENN